MDTQSALETSLKEDLAQSEEWARQGRKHVAHLRHIVDTLQRDGHDTTQDEALLQTLLETQTLHEEGVRRVLRELETLRARGPGRRAGVY